MTYESALRLARELYSPFVSAGLVNEKAVESAARIILSHIEIEKTIARIRELEEQS